MFRPFFFLWVLAWALRLGSCGTGTLACGVLRRVYAAHRQECLCYWLLLRGGEGAHQENELPALVFGEAAFECGHGLLTFADLIKDFAVGDAGVEGAIA